MKTGWRIQTLGEACVFERGLTYSKADEVTYSRNAVLRANNIDLLTNKIDLREIRYISDDVRVSLSKKVKRGSLIICTASGSKSHLGKVAIIEDDHEYAFGGFMGQITPQAHVDPKYLFYVMISTEYKSFISDLSNGMNINNLKFSDLQTFPIVVPSLSEQKRIVAILDEAFEGIDTAIANAKKNLASARELFDSYLNIVFGQEGDQALLSELATDITDGDHSPPPKAASGVPFITISDIVKPTRTIEFANTFFVPDEYFQNLKANKKPRVGDVLYTVTGATLGIPVLVQEKIDFCFQRHIGLIRPKPSTNSVWLSYALLSRRAFSQATVGSTGTAQKTVSLAVLRNIKVPKIGVKEQCALAQKLDALSAETQRLETLYQHKLVVLAKLKQAILQKAFAGELTAQSAERVQEAAE